jgi:hypothetical protein
MTVPIALNRFATLNFLTEIMQAKKLYFAPGAGLANLFARSLPGIPL